MKSGEITEDEAQLHDENYQQGWNLIRGLILLDGKRSGMLTWFGKRRLRKAVQHFEVVLRINPASWQSMCALGKIYQRLGEHQEALKWFTWARRLDSTQSALAREAGLEALALRDPQHGIKCFGAAIRLSPGDSGLVSNLALAQLLAGSVDDARSSVGEAVARDPKDKVARAVSRAIEKVRKGAPNPSTVAEVVRLAKW